ncbi:glycoside hydrolase [Streptomyces phage SheRa]|nr:glycoside hydrolase [Streptomyces phage SheRa]
MPYVQTLIDDFADGTLDSTKWEITQGPGTTESGGTLNLSCVADYPRVEGKQFFDLSKGILAAKLTVSGTRSSNTEFYIGAHDAAYNAISAMGGPAGSYLTFQGSGSTTFNTQVTVDTTVGLGPSWVNGTWWGLGNLGADNILYMYKSTDGQNWTEMAHCTVGGTFTKTAAGLVFMAGVWDGSTPSLVANFDDASYFALETMTFVTRKVRWNGAWIPAVPKARIGGAWVPASPKPRIGGAWDDQI